MFNNEMPYDNDIDINITNQNVNTNSMQIDGISSGTTSNPIIEPGRERCVYRNIYHEVPQE